MGSWACTPCDSCIPLWNEGKWVSFGGRKWETRRGAGFLVAWPVYHRIVVLSVTVCPLVGKALACLYPYNGICPLHRLEAIQPPPTEVSPRGVKESLDDRQKNVRDLVLQWASSTIDTRPEERVSVGMTTHSTAGEEPSRTRPLKANNTNLPGSRIYISYGESCGRARSFCYVDSTARSGYHSKDDNDSKGNRTFRGGPPDASCLKWNDGPVLIYMPFPGILGPRKSEVRGYARTS